MAGAIITPAPGRQRRSRRSRAFLDTGLRASQRSHAVRLQQRPAPVFDTAISFSFASFPLAATSIRPRIAYLITNSEIGGAQAHVADLIRAMREHADITLLAGGDGPLLQVARSTGANVVQLKSLDNALSPLRALQALRELRAALQPGGPRPPPRPQRKAGALGRVAAGC